MRDPDWQADLAPLSPAALAQGAVDLGDRRLSLRPAGRPPPAGLRRRLLDRVYWLAFRVTETLTGISIPKSVRVGPGLRIWHFGNIFVHADAEIGANCTLRQGVTIGNRVDGGPVPVIEDDVELGAYAQVLGGVRVGRGAKIGAMSVVLRDVPAGAVAVGVPARIVGRVPAAAANPVGPRGRRLMKAALIGAGQIARQHLACLRELPGVEVAAVCDLSPAMAESAAERFGVPPGTPTTARCSTRSGPTWSTSPPPHVALPAGDGRARGRGPRHRREAGDGHLRRARRPGRPRLGAGAGPGRELQLPVQWLDAGDPRA